MKCEDEANELARFREREPLVQALVKALSTCPNDDAVDEMCPSCLAHLDAVRNFDLKGTPDGT